MDDEIVIKVRGAPGGCPRALHGLRSPRRSIVHDARAAPTAHAPQAEKLAAHGYRVVVPDLYRGKLGVDAEEASHLMGALDFKGALADIRGAAVYLLSTGSPRVGAIGFCMGGALACGAAISVPEVTCAVPFYGYNGHLGDPKTLPAGKAIQAHFGRNDTAAGFADVATAEALRASLAASPAAATCSVIIHDGVAHAFMNASAHGIATNAKLGYGPHVPAVVDAAWSQALAFLHTRLAA